MIRRLLRLLLFFFLASWPLVFAQDTCVFDGRTFQRGDNLGDAYPLRCGSSTEYPCFCNPDNIERQGADCPYCGFSAGDGRLFCARDLETISFQDGSIVRVCNCLIPLNGGDPIRSCSIQTDPLGPTASPVDSSTNAGTCIFPNFDGDLVTFQNGESFGDLIEGICGPFDEWPSLCSAPPDGDGNDFFIDYPYCVFDDAAASEGNNGIVCARNGADITYETSTGTTLTCSCSFNSADGLQSTECTGANGAPISPAPVQVSTPTSPAPQASPTEEEPTGDGDGPGTRDTDPPTEEPMNDSGGASLFQGYLQRGYTIALVLVVFRICYY